MKHKILSFLTAFAMVFGIVAAPFVNASAEEVDKTKDTTKTVTLHKLIMTQDHLDAWDSNKVQRGDAEDGKPDNGYDGSQDLSALNTILGKVNLSTVKEEDGVYFALKFANDYADENLKGKYVKAGSDKLTPADPLTGTDNVKEAVGGLTTKNGITFNTEKLKGNFEIDEITELTERNNDGNQITDSKAVPVKITLPLVNSKGAVENAHVYPKNVEDKPKIDKNFKKADTTKQEKALEEAKGFKEQGKQYVGVDEGAKYENYQKDKSTAKAELGKVINYEIKTQIPAKSKLKTAYWDDKMTEGLTFDENSVKLTIGGKEAVKNTDYEVTTGNNGFALNLKEAGLNKINGQGSEVEVVLTYSATVNSKAIVDIPESNDVMFHYGNNPRKGNTPIPTKPNEGKIEVEKSWADGTEGAVPQTLNGKAVKDFVVKVKLVNANTGEVVNGYDDVELNASNKYKATFENLDNDTEYKVIEKSISYKVNTAAAGEQEKWEDKTEGFEVEYGSAEGKITLKNHKSNNPKPLNPTEPKVVTGGKRFVKTNEDGTKRLKGAEFYVKNKEGKYLVAGSKVTDAQLSEAKATLDQKVKAYNDLDAKAQAGDAGTKAKAEIVAAQKAYDEAFRQNAQKYTWGKKTDANVVVLTSDDKGRFDITGLEYGSYELEERKVPDGYATLNQKVTFEVKKGSFDTEDVDIDFNILGKGEAVNNAKKVINRLVTIPQTGGIGSIIFVVAGLMIMGLAAYKMKANKEEA